jgi:hypothetical protein
MPLWTWLACAVGPAFDGPPLLEVDSDAGLLHLVVRSDPQPPAEGVTAFEYTVTGADGPVDDLRVEVEPYMPAMDMGTSVVPTVTPAGDGVYVVENVDLVMPGDWELRSTFSGPVDDYAAPAFTVP